MKKIFALLLVITLFVGMVAPINVFAYSESEIEVCASNSPLVFDLNDRHIARVTLFDVGSMPTITFSATGNPHLNLYVLITTPLGADHYLTQSVPADGTVVSKRFTCLVPGDYLIYVAPASGSPAGQNITCVVTER